MKRMALIIAVMVALAFSTTAAFADHCPYGNRSFRGHSRYGSPYRGNRYGNIYGYRGFSPYGNYGYGARYGSVYPRYSNYGPYRPYGSYGRSGVSLHFGF